MSMHTNLGVLKGIRISKSNYLFYKGMDIWALKLKAQPHRISNFVW